MTRARTRATEREPMRRTPWGLALCVLILGAALAGCDGPNRGSNTQPSAASGFILDLVASPNAIPGRPAGSPDEAGGCSLVQAKVWDTQGNLVDGVAVQFTTSMCCFAGGDQINVVGATVNTLRGTANITFCGKEVRGTANINASVEDAFDSVLITVF
jgi:hypothetical protein